MPARALLIVATTLLALAGCDSGPGGPPMPPDDPEALPPSVIHAPDRPADAPDRVDCTPSVSDDPREMAEVRQQFERELDTHFRAALKQIREGNPSLSDRLWTLDEDLQWAFEYRRTRAIAELKRILRSDPAATEAARARAAQVLLEFGDPEGELFLFESLRSDRPSLRAAAIRMFDPWRDSPSFADPERARLVLARIDDADPAAAEAAIRLCARKKFPGTEARVLALLRSGKARDPQLVARELAHVIESPASLDPVLAVLLKDCPGRYDPRLSYGLSPLVKHPDPRIAQPARSAVRDFILRCYAGETRYDQSIVSELAGVADSSTIPVLEEIVAHARDPVSRHYAIMALARLHPETAVDRILEAIRVEGPGDMQVDALKEFATEADAERIIPALLGDGTGLVPSRITLSTTRLLLEKFGPRGREAVEGARDRLTPDARMWALWKLQGLDLRTALADLHAAGVIATPPEPLLDRMRQRRAGIEEVPPLDLSDPVALTSALIEAGILTMFDAETGLLPCRHDRLILEFAPNTNGRFAPECAVQTWHRRNADDLDAPYTVRFLLDGRLYRFGAENRSDWYDVAAVHRALNFALRTAGRRERFIVLGDVGQYAEFVFADPAAFEPIAARYGLPLSDDPDAPMRQGKAYEQHVIDQLRDKP